MNVHWSSSARLVAVNAQVYGIGVTERPLGDSENGGAESMQRLSRV